MINKILRKLLIASIIIAIIKISALIYFIANKDYIIYLFYKITKNM